MHGKFPTGQLNMHGFGIQHDRCWPSLMWGVCTFTTLLVYVYSIFKLVATDGRSDNLKKVGLCRLSLGFLGLANILALPFIASFEYFFGYQCCLLSGLRAYSN